MSKPISVGWVKDAHGLKGELYVQLFAKQADWLPTLKEFWLQDRSGGQPVHFAVERASRHKDGLIIRTGALRDRTAAEAYRKATFLIHDASLEAAPGEQIYLKQIEGFLVRDGERELGQIAGFSTNGVQDLLVVRGADKEILIPFVDAFLKQIDFDNRVVIMELPEGLEE